MARPDRTGRPHRRSRNRARRHLRGRIEVRRPPARTRRNAWRPGRQCRYRQPPKRRKYRHRALWFGMFSAECVRSVSAWHRSWPTAMRRSPATRGFSDPPRAWGRSSLAAKEVGEGTGGGRRGDVRRWISAPGGASRWHRPDQRRHVVPLPWVRRSVGHGDPSTDATRRAGPGGPSGRSIGGVTDRRGDHLRRICPRLRSPGSSRESHHRPSEAVRGARHLPSRVAGSVSPATAARTRPRSHPVNRRARDGDSVSAGESARCIGIPVVVHDPHTCLGGLSRRAESGRRPVRRRSLPAARTPPCACTTRCRRPIGRTRQRVRRPEAFAASSGSSTIGGRRATDSDCRVRRQRRVGLECNADSPTSARAATRCTDCRSPSVLRGRSASSPGHALVATASA
jgi:hypothetical protein